MTYTLHHGDCLEILPSIAADAVVSDPPYGGKYNTQYTRFTGGVAPKHDYMPVYGDDAPFDPSPWLVFPAVVLFGYNSFAQALPIGTLLVWCKRRDNQLGTMLSDCEVAWQKGGRGVYLYRHVWYGFDRESERGQKTLHPTQKPVAVMRWVIERLQLPAGATILDPYMGTGATGIAAVELGYNFIGIEREPSYFAIAEKRIEAAAAALQQQEIAL